MISRLKTFGIEKRARKINSLHEDAVLVGNNAHKGNIVQISLVSNSLLRYLFKKNQITPLPFASHRQPGSKKKSKSFRRGVWGRKHFGVFYFLYLTGLVGGFAMVLVVLDSIFSSKVILPPLLKSFLSKLWQYAE